MICLNLLLIAAILVFIIDLSGITQSIQHLLKKWLNTNRDIVIKPFMCSLCMTWWTTLLIVIFSGNFSIPLLAYCAALSFMTPVIASILRMVQDIVIKLIDVIYTFFKL
jgi:hypothetical protein